MPIGCANLQSVIINFSIHIDISVYTYVPVKYLEILNAVVLSALYLNYLLNYVPQLSNGGGPIHGLQNNSKGPDSKGPGLLNLRYRQDSWIG